MSFVSKQPRSADYGTQYAAAAAPATGLVRAANDVAALATAEFAPRAQTYRSGTAVAAG